MTSSDECLLTTDHYQACALQISNSRSQRAFRAPTSRWEALWASWLLPSGRSGRLGQVYNEVWVENIANLSTTDSVVGKFSVKLTCNDATTDLGESDFSLVKASAWNYSAHFTNLESGTSFVNIKHDHICDPDFGNCNFNDQKIQNCDVSVVLHVLVLFHCCFSSHQRPIETWAQVYKYLFAIFARYINYLWFTLVLLKACDHLKRSNKREEGCDQLWNKRFTFQEMPNYFKIVFTFFEGPVS